MFLERKIFKNTLFLSAGKNFGDLFSFILLMVFGRFFGAEGLGKYAFGMSMGGLFIAFTSLGLNTLIIREISRNEGVSQKYIGNLIIVRGAVSIVIFIAIIIGTYCLNLPPDTKQILILMNGYHIFFRLSGLLRSSFRAHDLMHYSALLEVYHKFIVLILGLGVMILFHNPVLTLAVYPLSACSMFIIALFLYQKKIGMPDFHMDPAFIKTSVFTALPFFIIIILNQFYDRIGIIFLTLIKGEASTGIFSAADKLLVTLFAGIIILNSVLLPYLLKLSVESTDQFYRLGERFLRLALIILLSVCLCVFTIIEPIMIMTFGNAFQDSILILRVHIWSFVFVGLNQILASMIIVLQKEKILLKIRILGYIAYCLISIFLIHQFDTLGLAFAKMGVESALFFATILLVYRKDEIPRLIRQSFAPLLSTLIGLALFFLLGDITLWIKFPATVFVYIAFLFIFKGVFTHDFIFLYKILIGEKDPPG